MGIVIRLLNFRVFSLNVLLFLVVFAGSACVEEKSTVIEDVGDYSITTQDYDDYYYAYIERAARIGNAEKKTLYKLMCNPGQAPNAAAAQLVQSLKPEENYKKYRELRLIEQAAKLENFAERPLVRRIIEQTVLEVTAQLYIQEKLEARIKITEEEKKVKCEELRKQHPARVGPLPIDRCMEIAGGFLKEQVINREASKIIEEAKESVVVRRNSNFNRSEYLNNELALYKTIQKEGGCGDEESKSDDGKKSDN